MHCFRNAGSNILTYAINEFFNGGLAAQTLCLLVIDRGSHGRDELFPASLSTLVGSDHVCITGKTRGGKHDAASSDLAATAIAHPDMEHLQATADTGSRQEETHPIDGNAVARDLASG
jgi:hypothetical protein